MPDSPARARPWVIAHRGASASCPENTAAAFRAALRARPDAIECDLRLTADGAVVVCHDADLRRFGGGAQPIARQTLARVQTADVGAWFHPRFAGERLPTLDWLLRAVTPRTTLLLELKPNPGRGAAAHLRALGRAVVAAVSAAGCRDRVAILCFSPQALDLVHRLDPGLRLVRNCDARPRRLATWLARHAQCWAADFNQRAITPALVAACHDAGLRVFTYTINRTADLRRVLAAGVDGVIGDDPVGLVRGVRRCVRGRTARRPRTRQ